MALVQRAPLRVQCVAKPSGSANVKPVSLKQGEQWREQHRAKTRNRNSRAACISASLLASRGQR